MHRTTHKISVALFNVILETNQERFSSLEIAQEGAYSQWSPEKMWVHAHWRGEKIMWVLSFFVVLDITVYLRLFLCLGVYQGQ